MADGVFPQAPAPSLPRPTPTTLVIPRRPLMPIFEFLGISIHDVVNDDEQKWKVRCFYRITRRIDNESWLRRRTDEIGYDAWLDAHL